MERSCGQTWASCNLTDALQGLGLGFRSVLRLRCLGAVGVEKGSCKVGNPSVMDEYTG